MLDRFDHVVIGTKDLAFAERAFQDAGFDVLDRKDAAGAIENRLVRFRDGSFIELLTFRRDDAHRFAAPWSLGDGWIDCALGCVDVSQEHERLSPLFPRPLTRRSISKATREGKKWQLELVEPGVGFDDPALPFLTEELTPVAWRVEPLPPHVEQPFGIKGIAGMTVTTADLDVSAHKLAVLYGAPRSVESRHVGTSALVFEFKGGWVELVQPLSADNAIADHVRHRGGGLYETTLLGGADVAALAPGQALNSPFRVSSRSRAPYD